MRSLVVLIAVMFLGGCVTAVKTYTIEKPRVDVDMQGNRGFLMGAPKEEPKQSRLGPNRKISVVEVEFGPSREEEDVSIEEEPVRGDNVVVREHIEEEAQEQYKTLPVENSKWKYYTIQKNDTLQKISSKFYGTTKKWKLLYDYNKTVLKSPDKVYPGIRIKIPSN